MSAVRDADAPVPLSRVLRMVGSHPGVVAGRFVRGRLRLIRTGVRIFVERDDFVGLCEAAWESRVPARRRGRPCPTEPKEPRPLPKPIHDGKLPNRLLAEIRAVLGRLRRR